MNFFEQQDAARRQSTRLVVLFLRGRRMAAGAAAIPVPVRAGTHV